MVAIYLDGASFKSMKELEPVVSGFTTNPSLMKHDGVIDYRAFKDVVLAAVNGKPVSFEVFGDDVDSIYRQANEIASWGENVYVKIPVMRTSGKDNYAIIADLSKQMKLNVTAILTLDQIRIVARSLSFFHPSIISIFAGRIADTGRDPIPFFTEATRIKSGKTEILWASTREVYNYYQAQQCGADIITMPPSMIQKLSLKDKDLNEYSRETVSMFLKDSEGLSL